MPNGIKYVLMATLFMVITKVIQVTAFDSEHYEKLQRESEAPRYTATGKKISNEQLTEDTLANQGSKEKYRKQESDSLIDSRAMQEPAGITLERLKENYLYPILANISGDDLREDIVIRYYRHKKDLTKVDKLRELSYYIHEKEAVETAGLGSNIIYYGDDVPLEDIQIIAFTLLEEGIPLKSIEHTKFSWKARAIEIGTDTTLLNSSNISIAEIQDFHKQYIGKVD